MERCYNVVSLWYEICPLPPSLQHCAMHKFLIVGVGRYAGTTTDPGVLVTSNKVRR